MNDTIPGSPVRVFLLIENRLLREALSRLCRKRSDFQIVGEADKESLRPQDLFNSHSDVVAFDFFSPLWLPTRSSDEGTGAGQFRAVLISMENDAKKFIEAVRAGVQGYLLKDASASDVIAAIRSAHRGEAICPPKLCTALFSWVAQTAGEQRGHDLVQHPGLTLRQRQLIGLVAQGLTNKEIANHLCLSEFTVRNHLHRIMKLVDVGTRREAVETLQMREGF